jgi:hypothetical protein
MVSPHFILLKLDKTFFFYATVTLINLTSYFRATLIERGQPGACTIKLFTAVIYESL